MSWRRHIFLCRCEERGFGEGTRHITARRHREMDSRILFIFALSVVT